MTSLRRCLPLAVVVGLAACQSSPPNATGVNRAEEREKLAALQTQLGVEYMREGNLELALKKLGKALEVSPGFVDALNAQGLLYARLGETDKAEASFRAALRQAPGNSFALNNYGQFLCQQKRYADGEARFLEAVKNPLYETPEVALTNAGLCALAAGKVDAAEGHLRAALERDPSIAPALFALAQISFDRRDYAGAQRYLGRFQQAAAMTPRALSLGIRIERALGNQDKVASYELSLRNQFPDSAEAAALARGGLVP